MKNRSKIFLVDNDLLSLNFYRMALEIMGRNEVSLFLNGNACLSNLHQNPFIVFLSLNMDDAAGLQVLKKIKHQDPNLYIIILSAQDDIHIAVNAIKYGAFDYIVKGDDDISKMENAILRIESIQKELTNKNPSFMQ